MRWFFSIAFMLSPIYLRLEDVPPHPSPLELNLDLRWARSLRSMSEFYNIPPLSSTWWYAWKGTLWISISDGYLKIWILIFILQWHWSFSVAFMFSPIYLRLEGDVPLPLNSQSSIEHLRNLQTDFLPRFKVPCWLFQGIEVLFWLFQVIEVLHSLHRTSTPWKSQNRTSLHCEGLQVAYVGFI